MAKTNDKAELAKTAAWVALLEKASLAEIAGMLADELSVAYDTAEDDDSPAAVLETIVAAEKLARELQAVQALDLATGLHAHGIGRTAEFAAEIVVATGGEVDVWLEGPSEENGYLYGVWVGDDVYGGRSAHEAYKAALEAVRA